MAVELTAAGDRLMDMLPHYYETDPSTRTIMNAMGRELERLEAFIALIKRQWFPQFADDEYGQLGLREELLGIPPEPSGISVEQRRAIVRAYEQARVSGAGTDWILLLSIALGAQVWEHEENDPEGYDLHITIPFAEGSMTTGQVEALADQITPAHLQLVISYDIGFIVGISRLGDTM